MVVAAAVGAVVAAVEPLRHRVGLGWRSGLASGIVSNLNAIDVVEVIAEDLFDAPMRVRKAMKSLARQVPVIVHGLSLGLASAAPVDGQRARKLAHLVDELAPEFWSEHLAFVRAGGVEIGHLAAPPRSAETLAGLVRNVSDLTRSVGARPLLENIATLISPAGSTMSEAEFVREALEAADADLLLDLHNLHANAVNFRFDPERFIDSIGAGRIRAIHLAGGRWIRSSTGERRLLDDHLHAVPERVYELLAYVVARAARPLTIIIERDGSYPEFALLLDEVERARRIANATPRRPTETSPRERPPGEATLRGAALEVFLARLYSDADLRRRFLNDRDGVLRESDLDANERSALCSMSAVELELAGNSYDHKRSKR